MQLAVIGAGRWGQNYLRVLGNITGASVKWCCDSNPSRVKTLHRLYPHISFTTSWEQVVSDPTVQALIIATQPPTHFPLVMVGLRNGKHVLVEKPCAFNLSQARQLWKEAEQKKVVLMTGHVMEYNPALHWVKDYIESGKLGNLLYVYLTRSSLGIVRHDVNVLWDLAIHDLSILRFLLEQEPENITAQGACYLQPHIHDVIFITLRFPGNILAQIHASWLESCKIRKVTLIGDRQMIVFDDVQNQEKIRVYDRGMTSYFESIEEGAGSYYFVPRYGDIYLPTIAVEEPLQKQCQHFLDCIQQGCEPITGKQDALWVTKVAELAQFSLENKGAPVAYAFES